MGITVFAAAWPFLSTNSVVAQTAEPDTSDWVCRWCEFETGVVNDLESGFGYVSKDSFKFGEYNGLGTKGVVGTIDGRSEYRDETGRFWALNAQVLGSERVSAAASVGMQGSYEVSLAFDRLPHLIQDTARSPLSGVGALQLPANWVGSSTTAGMTELAESLRTLSLKTERERLTLGGSFLPGRNWTTALRYSREEKSGRTSTSAPIGGRLLAGFPFMTQSTLIQQPTDSVTHLLDATVSHQSEKSHVVVGYQSSFFEPKRADLQWQNPFIPLTGNDADFGRLALRPDNEFHQLYGTLGYRLSNTTRATARVAVGRMEQDENILPYTINSALQSSLPRSTVGAEVNTHNYQLKLSSRPARGFSLNGSYTYADRVNNTPRSEFNYVITDAAASPITRFNRNYSFESESIDLSGAYRFGQRTRLSFGYRRKEIDRTLQQIRNTADSSYWTYISFSPHATLNLHLRYTDSDRDGDEIQMDPDIATLENPLMRKYNLANRDRTALAVTISYTPNEVVALGSSVNLAEDEYTESQIGLTGSENLTYTADLSITPGSDIRMHIFASRQVNESRQAGSQSFSTPTWSADTEDSFDTLGFNIGYEPEGGRFSVEFDYTLSDSSGRTEILNTINAALTFPDLETRLHRAEFYIDYNVSEMLSWRFGWLFEDYDSADWSKDGVAVATIPNVLSFGETSFSYRIHMPVMSLRYQF